jgi:hypothetical protein
MNVAENTRPHFESPLENPKSDNGSLSKNLTDKIGKRKRKKKDNQKESP